MGQVTLSIGRFNLAEPTLPSWVRILKIIEEKNASIFEDIIAQIVGAPDDMLAGGAEGSKGFMAMLGMKAVGIITTVPEVGIEVMRGCLRPEREGDDEANVDRATASDLLKTMNALVEQGVMNELIEQAKNVFSPLWTKLLARAREAASTKSAPA